MVCLYILAHVVPIIRYKYVAFLVIETTALHGYQGANRAFINVQCNAAGNSKVP